MQKGQERLLSCTTMSCTSAVGCCLRLLHKDFARQQVTKNLEPQQLASVELEAIRIVQTNLWSLSYFHIPLRKKKHWSLVKKNLVLYLPEKKTIRVWSLMKKHRMLAQKASLLSIWEIPHQSLMKKDLLLTKKASELPLREREKRPSNPLPLKDTILVSLRDRLGLQC